MSPSTLDPVTHSKTLGDLLRNRAQERPEQLLYTFLKDGETVAEELTFAALETRARAVAHHLEAQGLRGERCLLLYPPGIDFVVAFFGCLLAGVTAVPAYPPRSRRVMPLSLIHI